MAQRRESVLLVLEDHFSTGMAKAAATAALLSRELNQMSGQATRTSGTTKSLNGQLDTLAKKADSAGSSANGLRGGLGSLSAQSVQASRTTAAIGRSMDDVDRSARRADGSINQLTGRLKLYADAAAMAGPGAIPLGGVALAGAGGMANQLAITALAAGTAVVALQGVGGAIKAINDAALDPSEANLEKAREALNALAPAAQAFVGQVQQMRPAFAALREAAAGGLFPGLIESLDTIEARFPDVERILSNTANTLGALIAGGAEAFAGDEWTEFFDFLAVDAQHTLTQLGSTVGNLTRGLAELWMAFDPLNDDFSGWLLRISEDFANWSDQLSRTEGFREFVDYVRTNGPQVADTFSALGDAVLQIVEAASPLGGPTLQALEAVARVVGTIADSNLGAPLIAFAALNALMSRTAPLMTQFGNGVTGMRTGFATLRTDLASMRSEYSRMGSAQAVMTAGLSGTTAAAQRTRQSLGQMAGAAAPIAGLGLAMSGLGQDTQYMNTMLLASAGLMTPAGAWGGAIGAGVGYLLDLSAASETAARDLSGLAASLDEFGQMTSETSRAVAEALGPGVLTRIEELGISLNDVTLAVMAGGDSLVAMQERIRAAAGGDMFDASGAALYASALGTISHGLEVVQSRQSRIADASSNWTNLGTAGLQAGEKALASYTEAIYDYLAASRARQQATLEAANADLAYASALLDTKESMKSVEDGGQNLKGALKGVEDATDATSRKQIAAMGMLNQQAGAWTNLSESAKAAPGAYKAARAEFVQSATQMGMTEAAARKLAKQILQIPDKRGTKTWIDGAGKVIAEAEKIGTALDFAARPRTAWIAVAGPGIGAGAFAKPMGHNADGGTIPKDGKPYADRHLYMLAPGEEVISNRRGQADRFRPLLKAINNAADGTTVPGANSGWPMSLPGMGNTADNFLLQMKLSGMSLKELQKAIAASEKALDKETSKRDGLLSAMDSIASSMSRFQTQIFGRESKAQDSQAPEGVDPAVWAQIQAQHNAVHAANSANDWRLQLNADIATSEALAAAIAKLERKGFDGAALQELLEQASSLEEVQRYAGMNGKDLRDLESLYEQRASSFASTGAAGGEAAFGKAFRALDASVRAQTKSLGAMEKQIAELNKSGPRRTGEAAGTAAAREIKNSTGDGRRRGDAA